MGTARSVVAACPLRCRKGTPRRGAKDTRSIHALGRIAWVTPAYADRSEPLTRAACRRDSVGHSQGDRVSREDSPSMPARHRRIGAGSSLPGSVEVNSVATMTDREALNLALSEEMRRDGRVFVVDGGLGPIHADGMTPRLLDEFDPRRVVHAHIAESGFIGVGIGA